MKTFFLILTLIFCISARAEDAAKKVSTCSACHGDQGISPNDTWPNLAGQKESYIVKQLTSFREGVRVDPLMSPISKMLSDQDIRDLASYFAHLKGIP